MVTSCPAPNRSEARTSDGADFARLVKRTRCALGATQKAFGLALGVRERQVQRWEAGECVMQWAKREQLVDLLADPWALDVLRDAGLEADLRRLVAPGGGRADGQAGERT